MSTRQEAEGKHFNRYCYSTERMYQIKVFDAETGLECGRTEWCTTLEEVEALAKELQRKVGDTA